MKLPLTSLLVLTLVACDGGPGSGNSPETLTDTTTPDPLGTSAATCAGGLAHEFACSGIDLAHRVSHEEMGGTGGNDIWGWVDPDNGREYAIVGMRSGTAFVDVTDAQDPVVVGRLPTETFATDWRDVKVHSNHAYVVADDADAHGMQVFDLTRLRAASGMQTFTPDVVYPEFDTAHNIAINEATGFAFAVGVNSCHGMHMIDITTPNNPTFAGCHDTVDTHDTQCVVYAGPDADHTGKEICVSSNERHVEIVDVTMKTSPVTLSSSVYPQTGFVHQGWLTEDQRFFLLGDELDEIDFGVPTRTHVFDVSDLDSPEYVFFYEAETVATDHNLYVLGNRVYEANYSSGLRVLEFGDLANSEMSEIGYFDTFPDHDSPGFSGAWSVYPYLPSGSILVNDRANGLFILTM